MFYGFNAPAYNMMSDTTGVMSLMNASMADSIARNMMYQTNVFGGGIPLNPFAGGCGDFMGLWNMTVAQGFRQGSWGWNPDTQTFFPQFCNMGFGNYSYGMGANLMGWQGSPFQTPWQTPGSNNGGSKKETNPNVKEFNQLLNFLKEFNAYATTDGASDVLTAAQRKKLGDLVRKTYSEENYTELKNFYKDLEPNAIRKFLKEGGTTLLVTVDNTDEKAIVHAKNKEESLKYYRDGIGFEHDDNSVALDAAQDFDTLIATVDGKSQPNPKDAIGELCRESVMPLDVISTWNTLHKPATATAPAKTLAHRLKEVYNIAQDETAKKTSGGEIKRFVDIFTAQAKEYAKGDMKTKINTAIANLNNSIKDNKLDDKFVENFNTLYILTRLAAAKTLAKTLISSYGTIDSEVFEENLFIADTEADLEAEGFKKSEIKKVEDAAGITPNPKKQEGDPQNQSAVENANITSGKQLASRLFRGLNGLNAAPWGLDLGIRDDGQEKARKAMEEIGDGTDALVVASLVKEFNIKSNFSTNNDKDTGIISFIMDESWSYEETAVQKIMVKVLEMCNALKEKGLLTISSEEIDSYSILNEVVADKDAIEEYDNDKDTMIKLDKFIERVCKLYIDKFGEE